MTDKDTKLYVSKYIALQHPLYALWEGTKVMLEIDMIVEVDRLAVKSCEGEAQ